MVHRKKKYTWYFLVDESIPNSTKEKYRLAVEGANSKKWGLSLKYGTWQDIFGTKHTALKKKYSRFLIGEYAKKLRTVNDKTCAKSPLPNDFYEHPNRGTALCLSVVNETTQVVAGISFTMGDGGKNPFQFEGEYICSKTGKLKYYRELEEYQNATNAHDFGIRESFESELSIPLLYLLFSVGTNLYKNGHTTHAFWFAPRNNLLVYYRICCLFTQVNNPPRESIAVGCIPPELSCKVETYPTSARLDNVRSIRQCSEKIRLYQLMFVGTHEEIHNAMEFIQGVKHGDRVLESA